MKRQPVSIDQSTKEKLKNAATRLKISESAVIRALINKYVSKLESGVIIKYP